MSETKVGDDFHMIPNIEIFPLSEDEQSIDGIKKEDSYSSSYLQKRHHSKMLCQGVDNLALEARESAGSKNS